MKPNAAPRSDVRETCFVLEVNRLLHSRNLGVYFISLNSESRVLWGYTHLWVVYTVLVGFSRGREIRGFLFNPWPGVSLAQMVV
jgi:hypothetical protein